MGYTRQFTDALQYVWDEGFLSPGGPEAIDDILKGHDLRDKRVLDIGSGLGGIDVLLVQKYGAAEVVGIDVEPFVVDVARELVAGKGLGDRISFEQVEPGPLPFADRSFAAVFTKDALVHVEDKLSIYREVFRVLRPGGQFVGSDWFWSEGAAASPAVKAWLGDNPLGFRFTPPKMAKAALVEAGFTDVRIEDRMTRLQQSNRSEIALLEGEGFNKLAELIGAEAAADRARSARGRQGTLDAGDLIPCNIAAIKPA